MIKFDIPWSLISVKEIWKSSHSAIAKRVGLKFERVVEGSILTVDKKVESENLNVIIRAIN